MKRTPAKQKNTPRRPTSQPARRPTSQPAAARPYAALIVLLCLLLTLVLGGAATAVYDARHVRFYMNGSDELRLPYGAPYDEPGVRAVSVGRLFGEGRMNLPVKTEGEVGPELGRYTLRYVTPFFFRLYTTERHIEIVDEEAPVITLQTREGYRANWLEGYQEEGFTARDNHDGDLSSRVQTREEGDEIVYTVTDSSGNTATAVRRPDYAVGRPTLNLRNGERIEIYASLHFNDPGVDAYDALGNDLSEYVQVEGEVDSTTPGDYELTYQITNALGERVSAIRNVTVLPMRNPDVIQPDRSTIYLTFDDGPGPYTAALLDVLARYNVKATFFVTCLNPRYADMVGRAYREGHSIGVHSASHNYHVIYESEEAFYYDFDQVEQMIFDQTGSYTSLFRFPGGSSNTVSSFNPGIMTRLAANMTNMGYVYFDWNVDSDDAGGTRTTDKVLQNMKDGCAGRRVSVVLQHDIKDYSVNAVEQFIKWALNNGYQFAALDESSPRAQHPINN